MTISTAEPDVLVPAFDRVQPAWRRRLSRLNRKATPYAFVSPFYLIFFAFGLFPLVYTGWVSLHAVDLQSIEKMEWVGLRNYTRLWDDPFFWRAFRNTITIGVLSTVPQLLLALGIAQLLNYKLRGRTFFRVSMLLPYATSVAAATIVFAHMFGRDHGLINEFLRFVHLAPIDWEAGRWSSQVAISVIVTWRWAGYNALIYLAGMQTIPADLYEAAALDGAGRWRQFRHVTLPGLKPTIVFTVILSSIGATQLFAEPLLFSPGSGATGGANGQYQTLGVLLYRQGWVNFQLGRAAATAWTMFAIIVLVVAVNATIAARSGSGGGLRLGRLRKESGR